MAENALRRALEPDGYFTPLIKPHSVEKIRIHNYYLDLFTTSMKERFPQRAYVGLYSGPGRACIEGTGEIIETTAMSAFRPRFPFTKYIFVDNDPRCIRALEGRIASLSDQHDVTLIEADVGGAAPQIIKAMPDYSSDNPLLSFCFVDPFSAALDFEIIRALGSRYMMDFLILLMLGRDVRTNFQKYFQDPNDTRIASLIDDPNWRREWRREGLQPRDLVRYLLRKFDTAMTRLGYEAAKPSESHPIKVAGKNVFLYSLVFYSKNQLGKRFWQTTRKRTNPQLNFGF